MASIKGRTQRPATTDTGDIPTFVRLREDVRSVLDRGAAAMNTSLSAFVEELVRRAEKDERGLPVWVPAQLPYDGDAA
ncbi:MAG: hypothetical protein ACRDT6_27845 [Micromonosporaceae bacterium]